MKKRILAFTLILAMLLSMASITVFAADTWTFKTPAGAEQGSTAKELIPTKFTTAAQITALKSKVLTTGLSTVADQTGTDANLLKALESTDLGFSVIGVKQIGNPGNANNGVNRFVSNAVDGAWRQQSVSAVQFFFTGKFYDKTGATAGNTQPTGNYIYTHMYTFNLGEAKAVEALGFINGNPNDMPQTFDIYVSQDGKNWGEPVAYFDRLAQRTYTNGTGAESKINFTPIYDNQATVWAGANDGGTATAQGNAGGRLFYFAFADIQTAKYVRIAATSYMGVANSAYVNDDRYVPGKGSTTSANSMPFSEIMLFGTDPQIEMSGVQTTSYTSTDANGDPIANKYDARFVAEISKALVTAGKVAAVSFKITATFNDVNNNNEPTTITKTVTVNTVYEQIWAKGEAVTPTDGSLFAVYEITGIPTNQDVTFTVTPIIDMVEGADVIGVTKTITLPAAEA